MQWTPDRNAGFSTADPGKLYLPVISSLVYHYNSVNVEAQTRFDTSLLNWMRQMLHLRKEHHVFGRGSMRFVKPENRKIFAFLREHDADTVLCVFNLSQFAQPVELGLAEFEGRAPVEMLGKTRFPAITARAYQLALAPFGFYWFRLEERGR
jgi:maltose alpha-D-glucosyltransferase/alpha-amylase